MGGYNFALNVHKGTMIKDKLTEFRTAAKPGAVDMEARTISRVKVMSKGEIKDYRGWFIDDKWLDEMTAFAKKQKNGVLCNFDHNYNNLGKRVGRMSNFEREGDDVFADLSIFKAADIAPGMKDMGIYVLTMATEDSEAMMMSVRANYKYEYQLSGSKEIIVNYYDDDMGWVSANPDLGPVMVRFKDLRSVDIVGEGAATDSLFSTADDLLTQFNKIINQPGFGQILADHHQDFGVLNQFYNKKRGSLLASIKSLIGLDTAEKPDLITNENTDIDMEMDIKEFQAAQQEIATLKTENDALKASNADLSTKVSKVETDFSAALARIEALEKKPLDDHSQGNEEDDDTKEVKLKNYEKSPINKRWLEAKKKH